MQVCSAGLRFAPHLLSSPSAIAFAITLFPSAMVGGFLFESATASSANLLGLHGKEYGVEIYISAQVWPSNGEAMRVCIDHIPH